MNQLSLEKAFEIQKFAYLIDKMNRDQLIVQIDQLCSHYNVQERYYRNLAQVRLPSEAIEVDTTNLSTHQLRVEAKFLIRQLFEQRSKYQNLIKKNWGITQFPA